MFHQGLKTKRTEQNCQKVGLAKTFHQGLVTKKT